MGKLCHLLSSTDDSLYAREKYTLYEAMMMMKGCLQVRFSTLSGFFVLFGTKFIISWDKRGCMLIFDSEILHSLSYHTKSDW